MRLELLADRLHDPDLRELVSLAVGPRTNLDRVLARYATDPAWGLHSFTAGGSVVAILGLEVSHDGQALIRHIAVAPSHRLHGLGRALILAAHRELSLAGMRAETDADAVGFYRRLGFTIGRRRAADPGVKRWLDGWPYNPRRRVPRISAGSRSTYGVERRVKASL